MAALMVTVLRKDHSLAGRSCLAVIKAVRAFKGRLSDPLAHLKKDHPLEKYASDQLVSELEGLLGAEACNILEMAGVEGAEDPVSVPRDTLLFTLHTSITEANAKGQPEAARLRDSRGVTPDPCTGSSREELEKRPQSPEAREAASKKVKKKKKLCGGSERCGALL